MFHLHWAAIQGLISERIEGDKAQLLVVNLLTCCSVKHVSLPLPEKEEEDACEGDRVLDRGGPRVHQPGQLQLADGHHLRPQHDARLAAAEDLVQDPGCRKIRGS